MEPPAVEEYIENPRTIAEILQEVMHKTSEEGKDEQRPRRLPAAKHV